MKCLVCDCIFQASYEKCPVCGNYATTREELANTLEIAIENRPMDIALKTLLIMVLEELRKEN